MKNKDIPDDTSSLDIWLAYIGKLHSKTIDMSLERINKVSKRLNILRPAPFVFTVTGTNGKGTTCSMLESVLIAAGYRIGVYSSPHLLHYTERIRVQNCELPVSAHIASFIEIETVRDNTALTYFEYSTLSALWLFKQAKLDVVILEVGLGGRLDATNIVDADVAIITNIALDHIDLLGSDRESIGREKAGIFRTNKPAIFGELDVPKTVIKIAQEKRARLLCYDVDWQFSFISENMWCYNDKNGKIANLPLPNIPESNVATALAALRTSPFKIEEQIILESIKNVNLPGRFQVIDGSPRIILDVAHNLHAIMYLLKRLGTMIKTGQLLAVVGIMRDKDIAGILTCMSGFVDIWYCASLEEPRGASAEYLVQYINKGKTYASVIQAWNAAINDANPDDIILVCGSFHTVAYVMKEINIRKIIADKF